MIWMFKDYNHTMLSKKINTKMVASTWLTRVPWKETRLWRMSSNMVIVLVAACSKVIIGYFNKAHIHNEGVFVKHVCERPQNKPLLTVSNHYSMVDDTLISYVLPWRFLFKRRHSLRWLPGAEDVCFQSYGSSLFFLLGKVIPVTRGGGVYQPSMNFCAERLSQGEWVHLYPEGRINMEHERIRLKWGVGRLVADSQVCPVVLPYWHVGMDDMFPTKKPYRPRAGNNITVVFGEPIDFEETVKLLKGENKTDEEIRKRITDMVQEVLQQLKLKTEQKHSENIAISSSHKSSVI